MYPTRELSALAQRKALLRTGIAVRRLETLTLAATVARPVAWLDRAHALWSRISPAAKMAAVPLLFMMQRRSRGARPGGFIGRALRLLPLVMSAARMTAQRR